MSGHYLHFMGLLPNIGDVMTSKMCFEYNHPAKQLRIICMNGLTKPLFQGRLRSPKRLTEEIMNDPQVHEDLFISKAILPHPIIQEDRVPEGGENNVHLVQETCLRKLAWNSVVWITELSDMTLAVDSGC